ncbi:MAG: hypothetical protein M3Q58_08200 [Bacteroidota bacterium]|nr:hypothetical protein [Bacteroidota bacterium]
MRLFLLTFPLILLQLLICNKGYTQNSGLQIDPRISIYYSQEEIENLEQNMPNEIKKLNHYFQNSFIVQPSTILNADKLDLIRIDARRFENQRHATERVTVVISKNDDKLILKSKEELEKEYLLIK